MADAPSAAPSTAAAPGSGGAAAAAAGSWRDRMKAEASAKPKAECEAERKASLKCSSRYPDERDERCAQAFHDYRACMSKAKESSAKTRSVSSLLRGER